MRREFSVLAEGQHVLNCARKVSGTQGKGRISTERFHMTSRAVILVFQNNEKAAMLVYQENPVGVELFSHVDAFFCSNKFA